MGAPLLPSGLFVQILSAPLRPEDGVSVGWRGCQPLQEVKQAQNRGRLVHCVPKYWHTVSISRYFIFFLSGQSKLTAPGAQHKNMLEGVVCSRKGRGAGQHLDGQW